MNLNCAASFQGYVLAQFSISRLPDLSFPRPPVWEALNLLMYMLHPIREIAYFVNWPYYSYPFHQLGDYLFIFFPVHEVGKNMKRPAT
jgi:hypothetical protein